MRDGAFRPPVKPPQELLPLSRLPRNATTQTSNPSSNIANLVSQNIRCKPDMRALRDEAFNVCVPGRAAFNVETPHQRPYEVKNSIQLRPVGIISTNKNSAISNNQIMDNKIPSKEIQNRTYSQVNSKVFKQVGNPMANASRGIQPIHVKDTLLKGSRQTNISAMGNGNMESKQQALTRNLPSGSMSTNASNSRVNLQNESTARKYIYLPSKTPLGSFENGGCRSSFTRPDVPVNVSSKPSIMQQAYRMSNSK